LYYNRVSMVTKHRILGKTCCGKKNVGLDPWKNGYSRINPRRWQVFCLWFDHCWK
jgi:hypothetical protein